MRRHRRRDLQKIVNEHSSVFRTTFYAVLSVCAIALTIDIRRFVQLLEIIFRHIVKGRSNAWRVVVTRSPDDRPVGGYSPLFGR